MIQEKINPASLATGRAGNGIRSFEALDTTSITALTSYPQAYLSRKFHLQPVVARLVADLAGLGTRAR